VPTRADELLAEGLAVLQLVARRIARRLGHRIPLDDLMALGHPALIEITRSYNPARASFNAYARIKLRWAILDGIRRETRWRTERARACALSASERYAETEREGAGEAPQSQQACEEQLGRILSGHAAAMALGMSVARPDVDGAVAAGGESPEDGAARAELADAVRRAVRALPERERALIERHYYEGERFDRIAQDLGISKSRASRLHAQGIERLGDVLRARER
jgi:RNA polymerase sigma factor for flagellar operon FliA